jgi:isoamylase
LSDLYRDELHDFVRGNVCMLGIFAKRITGSADLYQHQYELASNSINFINSHDGFTLNDLVSYNHKHNQANGENNNDGVDNNRSWNCAVEGITDDPQINSLCKRKIKNFTAILMLSKGVPMFVVGDEICRTQQGKNNAYCQNNELSWFNWQDINTNKSMLHLWQRLIVFRKAHPRLFRNKYYNSERKKSALFDILWHGCELRKPGWEDQKGLALAMALNG